MIGADLREYDAGASRSEAPPFTRLHMAAFVAAVFALGFDLGEIALGGGLSAVFSRGPSRAEAAELGWLLAAVYLGGAIGAAPAGLLADRYGRRRTIIGLLLIVAAASIAGALSGGIGGLTVTRGIAGLALGVLPVIVIAYLMDLLPPARRGPVLMAASALGFAGGPLLLLLLQRLTVSSPFGFEGWRWTLAIAGAGAFGCAGLFLWLPEAPKWLLAVGRIAAAEASAARFDRSPVLLRESLTVRQSTNRTPPPGPVWPRLLLVVALCLVTPCVTMSFPAVSGAVLAELGVSLQASLLYVALSSWGLVLGALAASAVLDRLERPTALVVCTLGMATGLAVFFVGRTPLALVVGSFGFQVFAAIYIVALNIYAAELFEVRRRAAYTAFGWGVQRLAAVAAILLLVPALRHQGPGSLLLVMLVCLAASMSITAAFGPRSRLPT